MYATLGDLVTSNKQNSSVLVLGAGGRLGAMLRNIWSEHPIAGLDLYFQSRKVLPERCAHQWSPGQPLTILPPCDTVIALWGQTAGDLETLALNAALAGHSRAVAMACGATRLFHLSSVAIYGAVENAVETDQPAPSTPYGLSKLALEARVGGFDDPGLRHCCLRLANVVGADSLAPALTGDTSATLDRFADGNGPVRSYIGAGDLAGILCALCRIPARSLPTLINIAAPQPIAMEDLIRAAGKEILWRDAPETATQRVTIDCTRLAHLLPDHQPETRPDQLIRNWHRHRVNP